MGYIYAFRNDFHAEDVYKIGSTIDVDARLKQANVTDTWKVGEFKCILKVRTVNHTKMEKLLHLLIKDRRCPGKACEFFQINLDEITRFFKLMGNVGVGPDDLEDNEDETNHEDDLYETNHLDDKTKGAMLIVNRGEEGDDGEFELIDNYLHKRSTYRNSTCLRQAIRNRYWIYSKKAIGNVMRHLLTNDFVTEEFMAPYIKNITSENKPKWANGGFIEQDGMMLGMDKKTGIWYEVDPVTMAMGKKKPIVLTSSMTFRRMDPVTMNMENIK